MNKISIYLVLICCCLICGCNKESTYNCGNKKIDKILNTAVKGEKTIDALNSITSLDLSNFETPLVTSMESAFDGCENDYIYGSFEIAENEMTETSYIASIYLLDDLVATEEGLRISMTKDEALEIYGTPDSESDTSIVYLKGDSSLTIIFESAESSTISSIVLIVNLRSSFALLSFLFVI